MQQEPNVDELLSRLVKVEAENRALKKQREKFGLTFRRYPEEGEAQFLLNGMVPYLTRIDSHCVVKEDPQNAEHILIEGDNISALVALQSTHKGKVDVIYIDPPYNTGNKDFVYNDRYVSNDDGFRHSKWLSFMERRLYLAKELLSETGVIFVSIDDHEQAALKMLMDGVFGRDNMLGNITWINKTQPVNSGKARFQLQQNVEYILTYSKTSKAEYPGFNIPQAIVRNYPYFNEEKGRYRLTGLLDSSVGRKSRESMKFPILGVTPPAGKRWKLGQATADEMLKAGNIILHNGFPARIIWESEDEAGYIPFWSHQQLEVVKTAQTGKSVLKNAIGGNHGFDTVKPVDLIKNIISKIPNTDAIVLDFFAGSGTTGHAVAALNAEDGGNRQCILVTNNFEQDGSPNGIARDVTAARMKAVLTGQWADGKDHEALPGNLHYYKIDFKKPVANMISNAQIMQSRFAGLAALSTGAHVRVEADEVPTSATKLRDALDAEEAVLLRGKDNLVLVWQDYDLLLDEPERVQDILEEVDGINAALETPLERIIYVPFDAEDTRDEFDFEGWEVVSFPVRYLREVANTVDMLVKSDLLLPLEATPADEEGDEGTTDIESDDPTASSGSLRASDD